MSLRTRLLASAALAVVVTLIVLGMNATKQTPGNSPGESAPLPPVSAHQPQAPAEVSAAARPVQPDQPDETPPAVPVKQAIAKGVVEELTWEDLMPAGEEERLTALYEAYYRDLDQRMMNMRGDQVLLSDLGKKRKADPQDPAADPMAIAEGSPLDQMPQIGTFNTVADLNNVKIRIPAYIVPLEFSSKKSYKEFLLAPYFGACIHTPPPPPNQIIYVKANPAVTIKDIWGAVWAEGVLTTQKHENGVGNAAYTLTLTKLEPYEH